MKRLGVVLIIVCLISGCNGENRELQRGIDLRQRLLTASGCSFTAQIRADYEEIVHTFTVDCNTEENGNLHFCVKEPVTLEGITGTLRTSGGELTFDDTALAFSFLADGTLSPLSAPWLFLNTLKCGRIRCAGKDGEALRITLDDSYDEDALQVDVWLNEENIPIRCAVFYKGRRILSVLIHSFQIL